MACVITKQDAVNRLWFELSLFCTQHNPANPTKLNEVGVEGGLSTVEQPVWAFCCGRICHRVCEARGCGFERVFFHSRPWYSLV